MNENPTEALADVAAVARPRASVTYYLKDVSDACPDGFSERQFVEYVAGRLFNAHYPLIDGGAEYTITEVDRGFAEWKVTVVFHDSEYQHRCNPFNGDR